MRWLTRQAISVRPCVLAKKEEWTAEGKPGLPAAKGRRLSAAAAGVGVAEAGAAAAEAGGVSMPMSASASAGGGRRRLLAYAKSHPLVGPVSYCSPRRRMPFKSINGDPKCVG